MDKYNTLGNRIKSRRQALNLSQSELSRQLNCTQAALSQYENGNREPGLNDLANIARCLNTTTDYLLGLTDIASTEGEVKIIGDYLGLTEKSIRKLHNMFAEYEAQTHEASILEEAKMLSGLEPGEEGYDVDYDFARNSAFLDLSDHTRVINDFICSQEFSVFISKIKNNLFWERTIYDMFRIAAKQYNAIESPVISKNIAEVAHSCIDDSEDAIKHYSLNLFDAQNALIDFCRNFTALEDIKKLDNSESLYKKIHYYIYSCTQSMFKSGNYSVEKMEQELADVFAPLLPTITDFLAKKS